MFRTESISHLAFSDSDNLAAWVTTTQDRLSNVYPACVQPEPSDEKRRVQDAIGAFCAYVDCLLAHCTGHGASDVCLKENQVLVLIVQQTE